MRGSWQKGLGAAAVVAFMLVVLTVAYTAASGQSAGGSSSITAREMRAHVRLLADDGLGGRETGEPGVERAERYIAGIFRGAGLTPLPGREQLFLEFPLYRQGFDASSSTVVLEFGESRRTARAGVDFRPFGFSDEGTVEADVVFAGYGITAPEYDYDDYDGLDVEGKIVLVLRHEPGENDAASVFDGASSSEYALFTTKARNALDRGAVGMILVTDPLHHGPGDDLRLGGSLRLERPESMGRQEADDASDAGEAPFLALQISRPLAREVVFPSGRSLEKLQRSVDRGERPGSFALPDVRARMSVKKNGSVESVPARNVVGFLPGRDEELADEWIVVGAHHDHIGAFEGEGDTVFNGADDNASGVSAVLELAEAFAGRPEAPRRSIVFATFTAEERGLLGSRALVEHGLVPVDDVVFMLNLDMIGRNSDRDLRVFGDGFARGLRETVETANRGQRLPLEFAGTTYEGNSDHDPFYRSFVPFAFFFTGTHSDYHQLGDHASKLDYERMQSIARLAYDTLDSLAERDELLAFVHQVDWLGTRIEVVSGEGDASVAQITGVDAGSRAEGAGLRVGDVLRRFNGSALVDPRDAGRRFQEVDPGEGASLTIERADAVVEVGIERAQTGYLGVFPGAVDEDLQGRYGLADGDGILLRRVVPDGPAAAAGLREGDIIARIGGRPLGRGNLGARLSQIGAGETVQVHVIRDGERMDVVLTLGERPGSG